MKQQQAKNTADKLMEKIKELPAIRLQEVSDFVDFLRSRSQKDDDPILDVVGCLSGKPLTGQEIEDVLYGRDPV
jgi:hypothetical protein